MFRFCTIKYLIGEKFPNSSESKIMSKTKMKYKSETRPFRLLWAVGETTQAPVCVFKSFLLTFLMES